MFANAVASAAAVSIPVAVSIVTAEKSDDEFVRTKSVEGLIPIGDAVAADARYLLAVWDPEARVATIHEAPVARLSRTVKSAAASTSSSPSGIRRKVGVLPAGLSSWHRL